MISTAMNTILLFSQVIIIAEFQQLQSAYAVCIEGSSWMHFEWIESMNMFVISWFSST